MTGFILGALLAILVSIVGGLVRVWLGPTVFDRLIAISLVTVNGIALIVLFGFLFGRPNMFLDIALGYAGLSFLLPIALGKYFESTGHR